MCTYPPWEGRDCPSHIVAEILGQLLAEALDEAVPVIGNEVARGDPVGGERAVAPFAPRRTRGLAVRPAVSALSRRSPRGERAVSPFLPAKLVLALLFLDARWRVRLQRG